MNFFQSTIIDASLFRRDFLVKNSCGALASFEGIVRNYNNQRDVTSIHYEAYEEMANSEITRILAEAKTKWPLDDCLVAHRLGSLKVGETAVLIMVSSGHRKEAFLGCSYLIDQIKVRVPIWKKEYYVDGTSEWTYCRDHHGHDLKEARAHD